MEIAGEGPSVHRKEMKAGCVYTRNEGGVLGFKPQVEILPDFP